MAKNSAGAEVLKVYNDFRDHKKFAEECLAIRDKSGKTVPFKLQPAQIRLNEIIERCRAQRRPVRIIVLKARQVMISAGTAAQFINAIPFRSGQTGLVVAHEADPAKLIFEYYDQLLSNYEPFRGVLKLPERKKDAVAAGVIEWVNGSSIRVATANNLKTGRGRKLRYLHLSEYAFWRDAKTLMMGLEQTVPDDPDTCIIIESTANGTGNDFHKRWKEACDPTSGSEWIPFFFPWHEHPEYVRAIADRATFQAGLTAEEIELRDRSNLSLERLHWRRWAIRNKCGGSPDTFRQEYPSNPDEAFLSTGRPRFSHSHLNRMPINDKGGEVGELHDIQNGPKRSLVFLPTGGAEPVEEEDRSKPSERDAEDREQVPGGAVVLYERPNPRKRYVIGVDTAEGKDARDRPVPGAEDPDYSVACVLDSETGKQVAKLRGRIEPGPFAEYVHLFARWYNWAYIVPEVNGLSGGAFLDRLLQSEYPPSLIYKRRPDADERFADHDASLQTMGWKTTPVSRPQLISKLDMAIREYTVLIVDPVTAGECRDFVIKPNGRAEHQNGAHDDEVLALGLAVVGMETMPPDTRLQNLKQHLPPGKNTTVQRYGQRRLAGDDTRGERRRW